MRGVPLLMLSFILMYASVHIAIFERVEMVETNDMHAQNTQIFLQQVVGECILFVPAC